jgi:hypothetical protein
MRIAIGVLSAVLFAVPATSAPFIGWPGEGQGAEWDTHTVVGIDDWFEGKTAEGLPLYLALSLDGGSEFLGMTPDDPLDPFDGGGKTRYRGGVLRLDATWETASGVEKVGFFTAPIKEIEFDLAGGSSCWEELPCGDLNLSLRAGTFDRELARALGLSSRRTSDGSYWMHVDFIDTYFEAGGWRRTGDWNGSDISLAVPEPSTLMLFTVAGLALMSRRRRRA